MSQELWSAVDDYIQERLIGHDPALEAALAASQQAGLPPIALTPALGKLLHLIARIHHARRILELGTLGGYSTIWLARALPPDGQLITLELNADYAKVAAANIDRAGLAGLINIKIGAALDSLRALIAEGADPFDLIFIDADKQGTPEYFQHALQLSRPGTVIITDNVVRRGSLIDDSGRDPQAEAMRRFQELLAASTSAPSSKMDDDASPEGNGRRRAQRVSATTVQTVGAKGYDGFTLALVEP